VARVGRSITIGGVRYSVLRLSADMRAGGPAFLLRSQTGDVIGLFRQGPQPTKLRAYYLRADERNAALSGFEFSDDGELGARVSTKS